MAHYSRLGTVVIDVPPADHDPELAFWQAAIGQPLPQLDQHPEYHGDALRGQEFCLLVQRLNEGPGRVHVDIHTDNLAAEVARLERIGAQRIQQVHSWQVMRDPSGLLFCVVPDPPGVLNDDNAQRWDDGDPPLREHIMTQHPNDPRESVPPGVTGADDERTLRCAAPRVVQSP